MDYTIRAANTADLQALTELYLTYSTELRDWGLQYEINVEEVPAVLRTRLKSKLFYIGVAEHDGAIIGFIICSIAKISREYLCGGSGQVGHISDLYVTSTMRRMGYAEALFESAKAWLKESGIYTAHLEVLSANAGCMSFMNKAGCLEIANLYQLKL